MKKRTLSMMLALLMAISAFGIVCTPVSVASAAETAPIASDVGANGESYTSIVDAALTVSYKSAQDKIDSDANMRPAAKYGSYELYVNDYTGEIAFKDMTTGQILLSNPYDVPSYNISEDVKAELLSQIVVGYSTNGKTQKPMNSYKDAAKNGQIKVSNSKNGILVEYTLGRESGNYLVPGRISEVRMQSEIFSLIFPYTLEKTIIDENGDKVVTTIFDDPSEFTEENILYVADAPECKADPEMEYASYVLRRFHSFYTLVTQDKMDKDPELKNEYQAIFNSIKNGNEAENGALYVRNSKTTGRDLFELETHVKQYCPNYTLEELRKDHEETNYVATDANPPLFKLALQYTLTENGLTIRLPANGIRFDHTTYSLDYVSPLQYFGAGNMNNEGYLFYPDGSGAILYYEDLVEQGGSTLTGKVYGIDYAYHVISGKHQESIRVPVFGAVSEDVVKVYDADGNPIMTTDEDGNEVPLTTSTTTGYLAILEEGDAMANITASWNTKLHNFASIFTTFYPRPKDTYDLSGTITVGSNTTWTVESSRKYTGSYEMHIYMLSDVGSKDALVGANRDYFEASYVGMAAAYSHYLTNVTNVLTALTASDVTNGNIPLYIEAFGTVPDIQRILSIPVEIDVPLTTFDDIQKMYDELSTNGISNVQFKLTGFANGGMYTTYPTKLKWMKEVGGKKGFEQLLIDANENNYGVYPEFDFMYINNTAMFDGISARAGAARTIDNRYANKRVFNATYQEFVSYFDLCVTPVMVEKYYQKFTKAFKSFDPIGISASTLGSDLNSDFGKKNPTNREEAKEIIGDVLAQMANDYNGKIMVSGGNAYALQYTQHLLDAALDSSRFSTTSRSVPFVGMVLHGYVNFAGNPINMAGNSDYQILKAIENGASVYFTLSYDNTDLLKQYEDLSQYYAVNYKIWAGTYDEEGNLTETGKLFEIYNRVNGAIGDLQLSKIVDHTFLIGERVPTDAELSKDQALADAAWEAAKEIADDVAQKAQIDAYRELYLKGEITFDQVIDAVATDEEIRAIFESYGDFDHTTDSDSRLNIDDYETTKYTMNDGMIVMVTYDNGTAFILNYNIDDVKVVIDGVSYVVAGYDFQEITIK